MMMAIDDQSWDARTHRLFAQLTRAEKVHAVAAAHRRRCHRLRKYSNLSRRAAGPSKDKITATQHCAQQEGNATGIHHTPALDAFSGTCEVSLAAAGCESPPATSPSAPPTEMMLMEAELLVAPEMATEDIDSTAATSTWRQRMASMPVPPPTPPPLVARPRKLALAARTDGEEQHTAYWPLQAESEHGMQPAAASHATARAGIIISGMTRHTTLSPPLLSLPPCERRKCQALVCPWWVSGQTGRRHASQTRGGAGTGAGAGAGVGVATSADASADDAAGAGTAAALCSNEERGQPIRGDRCCGSDRRQQPPTNQIERQS